MLTAPCKDCSDRHPWCHTECEKYIAFRKTRDEFLKVKAAQKQTDWDLNMIRRKRRGW